MLVVHLQETTLPSALGMSLSAIQAILRHELTDLDYRIKLLDGASDHLKRGIGVAAQPSPTVIGVSRKVTAALCLAVAVFAVAATLLTVSPGPQSVGLDPSAPLRRLQIDLTDDPEVTPGSFGYMGNTLGITPDGREIIFAARKEGRTQLYRRALGDLDATPISGSEAVQTFVISPDQQWLLFVDGGRLKRLPIRGYGHHNCG